MATRIAWLLNLDSDRELQDPDAYRASEWTLERTRELRGRMGDLIDVDDVVLDALRAPHDARTVLAFCPTPSACARIQALGFSLPLAPSLAILRRVNDRGFCAELGHGLEHSTFARDLAALERHLQQPSPTASYVLKRAFSFAGREQRRVRDSVLDDSSRGFCARSFARGEGIQVEPWVERLADFSRHGYLTREGQLLLGPTREQRCDALGRFQCMSPGPAQTSADEDALLVTELEKTASALTAAGYFGPFGLDAFRYRRWHGENGTLQLNPRCEINARFTMGYPRALLLDGLACE